MALRTIRLDTDPILRKKSKEVTELTDRIKILIEDMIDTMEEANGVGLAAPQVGVLRRVIVVDVGEGLHVMINPEIISEEGAYDDVEGCLSVPNRSGIVRRPESLKVSYLDENFQEKVLEAKELFARAICHEIDHLDGVLYTDKMIEEVFYEEED